MANHEKALEYLLKALELRRKLLGEFHSDTATSYNYIGIVYTDLADYAKALEYHSKELEIRQKLSGEEHPDTLKVIEVIEEIKAKMNA